MADRYAVIIRGPNGVGKSQTIEDIAGLWHPKPLHRVTLDQGWGYDPDPAKDWRRLTAGRARYRDMIDAQAIAADLLIIEIGLAEPDDGTTEALGATRNPREWIDLLIDRRLLLVRLSSSWPVLERKLIHRHERLGLPSLVFPQERRHYDRIEHDVWGVRFDARSHLVEHVVDMDDLQFSDAARMIVDLLGAAAPSLP